MIQLRLRTEGTFGQTFVPIDRLIEHLKKIGCTAAGIVDKGNTWLHVKFHEECKKAGIQPLLGIELAVGEDQNAMWFLARNETGLRELYRAASLAHKQMLSTKFGSVPRLFPEDVLGMSENIIKFAGTVMDEELLRGCNALLDLNPSSRVLNHSKRQMAERTGLRLVSTSDNAYCAEEDRKIFELVSSRGMKPSAQHILPELEHQDVAAEIALSCADLQMPKAKMIRVEGNLEQLCREGIKKREMEKDWSPDYEKRLQYELSLIREKDFDSYFIVVADLINWCKERMLVGPARGSSAGSLVCYLTRITEIDPIPPKLFFERFIDVSRSDLPDIDTDFPDSKRHLAFEYMAEKYGEGKTAHIGTLSTYKPKSALIQVCKRLNIPSQATGAVKAAMIERSSADSRANNCLLDTLTETEPGKQLARMYPQVILAAELEAHASHTGVHAAGLIVSNERIDEFCTIDENGNAQIEKTSAEKLGLLKIDVLGLRTLGILEDSGVDVDWYGLKFDDPEVYKVFNKQTFSCIFQFEGNAMRAVSRDIEFSGLRDIDAVTALARPGPFGGGVTEEYIKRRNGKPYEPIHPLVQQHMDETYGLPVYQEQTLAIVREIGKFDWKETSTIRKAMSKRMGKEFFDSYWEKFKIGATSQGIEEAQARKTWETINAMGAWQMNKAHTYSYAIISYWTAWLKAHHPLEFAAANLRNARDEETALLLLREMSREGITFRNFDPHLSEETWTIKDGQLIAGFDSLRGFGAAKSKAFVEARRAGKLTSEMIEKALAAKDEFADIFPMQSKYGGIYADPSSNGIASDVTKLADIDGSQEGSVVFIGRLVKKNPRNANEDVNVKKRGGKMLRGPLDFLDITIQDDTGTLMCRVDRYKFKAMGKPLLDTVAVGEDLLVRANFRKGIRFGFISKWRKL